MGDVSKNLSRSEMACNCGCGFDACDIELVVARLTIRKRVAHLDPSTLGARRWISGLKMFTLMMLLIT
jgi:hypothetical protein